MKRPSRILFRALVASLLALSGGCNVFESFDSPDGDAQLLSAARACFDRGDLECAKSNYQKLSADSADLSASEQAYIILEEQGMGMDAFMEFVGNGAQGKALTKLADRMASNGADKAKRLAIYQAFLKSTQIAKDAQLQAFVEFLSSLGLLAEMLAETGGDDSVLTPRDIVETPATCKTSNCVLDTDCQPPLSTSILGTAASDDIGTNEPNTTNPTADQVYWAIKHAYDSLARLQAGGRFSDTSGGLNAIFSVGKPGDDGTGVLDRCFRQQLLIFGIGEAI